MTKTRPKSTVVSPTLPSIRAWLRQHVKSMVAQATKLRSEVAKSKGVKADLLSGTVLYFAYMAEFAGILLKHGELFTERLPGKGHWMKRKTPQAKDCFFNAQTLCFDAGLPYYEGFYFSSIEPFQHAFNVVDGKVIDVTREAVEKLVGPSDGFWFGASVSEKAIRMRQMKTGQWGPALLPDAPVFDD